MKTLVNFIVKSDILIYISFSCHVYIILKYIPA
jgi:hypothetical protein